MNSALPGWASPAGNDSTSTPAASESHPHRRRPRSEPRGTEGNRREIASKPLRRSSRFDARVKAAVLGTGGLGRIITLELAADRRVDEIVIVDKRGDRSRALQPLGKTASLTALEADVTDGAALHRILAGVDVAVNATLPTHNLRVVEASFEAGRGGRDSGGYRPPPAAAEGGRLGPPPPGSGRPRPVVLARGSPHVAHSPREASGLGGLQARRQPRTRAGDPCVRRPGPPEAGPQGEGRRHADPVPRCVHGRDARAVDPDRASSGGARDCRRGAWHERRRNEIHRAGLADDGTSGGEPPSGHDRGTLLDRGGVRGCGYDDPLETPATRGRPRPGRTSNGTRGAGTRRARGLLRRRGSPGLSQSTPSHIR